MDTDNDDQEKPKFFFKLSIISYFKIFTYHSHFLWYFCRQYNVIWTASLSSRKERNVVHYPLFSFSRNSELSIKHATWESI